MRKTLDRYVKVIYILELVLANKYLSSEQSLVVVNALLSLHLSVFPAGTGGATFPPGSSDISGTSWKCSWVKHLQWGGIKVSHSPAGTWCKPRDCLAFWGQRCSQRRVAEWCQGGPLCPACHRGSWYDRGKLPGLKGSQSMGNFCHYKWTCCRH